MKNKVLLVLFSLIFAVSCQTSNKPNGDENMQQIEIPETGKLPVIITPESNKYCTTWASSQYETEAHNMPPASLKNNSIRQVVRTSTGANKIRVKFSNRIGESPLEIKAAHIAYADGQGTGKIKTDTDTRITFNNGQNSVTIPAYSEVYSDVFEFDFPALTELAISTYFGNMPKKLTGHPGSRTNSFIETGYALSNEKFSPMLRTDHWYVIAGIEEYDPQEKKLVVCLGDSITDGRGTTNDLQNRWTDHLATKLQNNDATKNVAVVNMGIGGTLVTSSGTERFDRDVINQPGVSYCIVLYGVNDLIYANMNANTLIDCYKRLIKKAHKNNILVYGGTILPFKGNGDWTQNKENNRLAVNKWILETKPEDGGFDAAFDFASVMKAENDERLPESFQNDSLHPTAKLYERMTNAITDLSLFTKTANFAPAAGDNSYNALNITSFNYKLPVTLNANDSVTVNVKGKNDGSSGFRIYLINNKIDVNCANGIYEGFKNGGKDYKSGDFDITFTLTAKDPCNMLMIKGPAYGANIDDVTFSYVSVTINGNKTEFDPAEDVL